MSRIEHKYIRLRNGTVRCLLGYLQTDVLARRSGGALKSSSSSLITPPPFWNVHSAGHCALAHAHHNEWVWSLKEWCDRVSRASFPGPISQLFNNTRCVGCAINDEACERCHWSPDANSAKAAHDALSHACHVTLYRVFVLRTLSLPLFTLGTSNRFVCLSLSSARKSPDIE